MARADAKYLTDQVQTFASIDVVELDATVNFDISFNALKLATLNILRRRERSETKSPTSCKDWRERPRATLLALGKSTAHMRRTTLRTT